MPTFRSERKRHGSDLKSIPFRNKSQVHITPPDRFASLGYQALLALMGTCAHCFMWRTKMRWRLSSVQQCGRATFKRP